ncbi:MAG: hypothetical protein KGJ86_14845 [Chloroflexota bacterium]|nr:hypothetical protein [Chloroflexota bacterium]
MEWQLHGAPPLEVASRSSTSTLERHLCGCSPRALRYYCWKMWLANSIASSGLISAADLLASIARQPILEVVDLPVPNATMPLTKKLTPMRDGSLLENDDLWPAGAKTIEQRTLELLNEGYALLDKRVDGSRFFRRSDFGNTRNLP